MLRAFFNFLIAWLVVFSSVGFCFWQFVSPNFIGDQAKNINLYNSVSKDVASLLPSSNFNDINLTSAEVSAIVTNSVSAPTFYDFFNSLTNTYSQWLVGRTNTLDFNYSLVATKNNLQTNLTTTLVTRYKALGTCTNAQLKDWQATHGLPACQLPNNNTYASQVNTLLAAQSYGIVNKLPDNLKISNPNAGLVSARQYTTETVKIIEVIWLVTSLLIAIYLLVFRVKAFFSLSFIFILAGILELGFGLIGWDWLARLISDSLKSLNQATASVVVDLSGAGLKALKTTLGTLSIFSLSAGTFFLVAGLFAKFRKTKDND